MQRLDRSDNHTRVRLAHRGYAAWRTPSTRLSHSPIWFQLAGYGRQISYPVLRKGITNSPPKNRIQTLRVDEVLPKMPLPEGLERVRAS